MIISLSEARNKQAAPMAVRYELVVHVRNNEGKVLVLFNRETNRYSLPTTAAQEGEFWEDGLRHMLRDELNVHSYILTSCLGTRRQVMGAETVKQLNFVVTLPAHSMPAPQNETIQAFWLDAQGVSVETALANLKPARIVTLH